MIVGRTTSTGDVVSTQLSNNGGTTAPEKEKACVSESASHEKGRSELLSVLKKSARSVCCANNGRQRPRKPATTKTPRLAMAEFSAKPLPSASKILISKISFQAYAQFTPCLCCTAKSFSCASANASGVTPSAS